MLHHATAFRARHFRRKITSARAGKRHAEYTMRRRCAARVRRRDDFRDIDEGRMSYESADAHIFPRPLPLPPARRRRYAAAIRMPRIYSHAVDDEARHTTARRQTPTRKKSRRAEELGDISTRKWASYLKARRERDERERQYVCAKSRELKYFNERQPNKRTPP